MPIETIKLITLNIWGGHVKKPLLEFVRSNQKIDIFCFQEVYCNAKENTSTDDRKVHLDIFSELQELLPEHQGFFKPVVGDGYGICMFIKKTISVLREGETIIYENPNYLGKGPAHSRKLQWAECEINKQIYIIMNIHGLWNGMGKTDALDRIAQSKRIRDFMNSLSKPKILCGDFNLRPDTESLRILEDGMNNHIRIHNIKSTRTCFYSKSEQFADYILTSPEIVISDFKVLPDVVSDHSPLLLEFS